VRELFDFGGHHRVFCEDLLGDCASLPEEVAARAADRVLLPGDLAFSNQSRGKFGSAAMRAGGAAQDHRVATVLSDALRHSFAVWGADLGDALESQDDSAADFAKACESIFEAVNGAKRAELVDDEPDSLVAGRSAQGFEDRKAHPGADKGL